MSHQITPRKGVDTIRVKTKASSNINEATDWWNSGSKKELSQKLLSTISFLKDQASLRYRQSSIYAKLYGNMPLMGYVGSAITKLSGVNNLPSDRPTMSVITSCVDTLVARLSQARPRPVFLTDNADYKQRSLAKQLNSFINGEFYQTKAYEKGPEALRDACVLGSGVLKILRDPDNRVAIERRLYTEILVDNNDSFYGDPRQMYEIKLVDRRMLLEQFPSYRSMIEKAENAYPDSSGDGTKTVSDMVMVGEGWRLSSGPDAGDGLHAIVCTEGVILEEKWERKKFPFVFLNYADRLVGFWGQGIAERQMGTQMAINQILMTAHKSLNLAGIPRVFIEDGSKVVKSHINNEIGAIVTYRGTMPVISPPATVLPAEMYQQLERLIMYAYKQEGISELSASSQKPSGLTSGTALREYDDIQSDRFSYIQKKYTNMYVNLAYGIMDEAVQIAKDTGSYSTVFPNKDGTKEINLPDFKILKDDPYIIQAFDSSSLPRDPAGRLQKITEMMQANIISPQEGRRLLDYPDIEQVDKLANAAEERILKILDEIVEEGKYTPPDTFMDLTKANELVVQYYNLYSTTNLEQEKLEMLRNFFTQIMAIKQQAAAAMAPQPGMGGEPQAVPAARPTSDVLPNIPAA